MGLQYFCHLNALYFVFLSSLIYAFPTSNPTHNVAPSRIISATTITTLGDQDAHELERRANVASPHASSMSGVPMQIMSSMTIGNNSNPPPGFIPNSNVTRDQTDCKNLRSGRDNKCWATLDLTNWVKNWVANNQCHESESFASCFLRKEGFYSLDCTGLKLDACTAPQSDLPTVTPEVFYVAYNIYGEHCPRETQILR